MRALYHVGPVGGVPPFNSVRDYNVLFKQAKKEPVSPFAMQLHSMEGDVANHQRALDLCKQAVAQYRPFRARQETAPRAVNTCANEEQLLLWG
ncbi:MAG: hypothetical protein KBC96_14770 [Armatimonadetes bacterium]|nr:hypothetical protein [Armatimonadota bacterium]